MCHGSELTLSQPQGNFLFCDTCDLTFREKSQWPSQEEEKAVYDRHNNDPQDPRYQNFLNRCVIPLKAYLHPGDHGLDYGCGPGPATTILLPDQTVECYDPFYFHDPDLLDHIYDFIVCTETAEHFHFPDKEWYDLFRRLKPGGILAVMTRLRVPREEMEFWWYKHDPTHVCFYAESTFSWIASQFPWTLARPHPDVAIFTKHTRCPPANSLHQNRHQD